MSTKDTVEGINPWPPHLYQQVGMESGWSLTELQTQLRLAHRLQARRLPAIFSLKHLSELTGVDYLTLRSLVSRTSKFRAYKNFYVEKRGGGLRRISIPSPSLMHVQRWICRYVLSGLPAHRSSFAYIKGRPSPICECARIHCGARWLIHLDCSQFFESISEVQVYDVFANLGYPSLLSFEMARLCTDIYDLRSRNGKSRYCDGSRWISDRRYSLKYYGLGLVGHLPQGAPTSPMLSNLAMASLDENISSEAERCGLHYTRYADDLYFSRGRHWNKPDAMRFVRRISRILRRRDMNLNEKKTVISPPGGRKIVLGLLVDGALPRLSRDFKDKLRQHFYYLEHSVIQHAEKRKFWGVLMLKMHIDGLLNYAASVEPEFAKGYKERFARINWPI